MGVEDGAFAREFLKRNPEYRAARAAAAVTGLRLRDGVLSREYGSRPSQAWRVVRYLVAAAVSRMAPGHL